MRRSWRSPLVLLGCLAISAYFIQHAIKGKHGLEARFRLTERSSHLEREIAGLEVVRARLARDVALLRPDAPHPDLVEEIAGDVLGFVRPGERLAVAPALAARP